MCNESVSEGLLVPMSDKELESMLNTAKDDMEWTERAKHLDEAGIKKQAKKKDDILEVGQIFFSIWKLTLCLLMYRIEIGHRNWQGWGLNKALAVL